MVADQTTYLTGRDGEVEILPRNQGRRGHTYDLAIAGKEWPAARAWADRSSCLNDFDIAPIAANGTHNSITKRVGQPLGGADRVDTRTNRGVLRIFEFEEGQIRPIYLEQSQVMILVDARRTLDE